MVSRGDGYELSVLRQVYMGNDEGRKRYKTVERERITYNPRSGIKGERSTLNKARELIDQQFPLPPASTAL